MGVQENLLNLVFDHCHLFYDVWTLPDEDPQTELLLKYLELVPNNAVRIGSLALLYRWHEERIDSSPERSQLLHLKRRRHKKLRRLDRNRSLPTGIFVGLYDDSDSILPKNKQKVWIIGAIGRRLHESSFHFPHFLYRNPHFLQSDIPSSRLGVVVWRLWIRIAECLRGILPPGFQELYWRLGTSILWVLGRDEE
jgi:hypothetical protein